MRNRKSVNGPWCLCTLPVLTIPVLPPAPLLPSPPHRLHLCGHDHVCKWMYHTILPSFHLFAHISLNHTASCSSSTFSPSTPTRPVHCIHNTLFAYAQQEGSTWDHGLLLGNTMVNHVDHKSVKKHKAGGVGLGVIRRRIYYSRGGQRRWKRTSLCAIQRILLSNFFGKKIKKRKLCLSCYLTPSTL